MAQIKSPTTKFEVAANTINTLGRAFDRTYAQALARSARLGGSAATVGTKLGGALTWGAVIPSILSEAFGTGDVIEDIGELVDGDGFFEDAWDGDYDDDFGFSMSPKDMITALQQGVPVDEDLLKRYVAIMAMLSWAKPADEDDELLYWGFHNQLIDIIAEGFGMKREPVTGIPYFPSGAPGGDGGSGAISPVPGQPGAGSLSLPVPGTPPGLPGSVPGSTFPGLPGPSTGGGSPFEVYKNHVDTVTPLENAVAKLGSIWGCEPSAVREALESLKTLGF